RRHTRFSRDWSSDVCSSDLTINGQTTTYADSGQVLNTGGFDGACVGNESTQWTAIGHAPCKGSLFSLAPVAQIHGLGTTATISRSEERRVGKESRGAVVTRN